MRYCRGIVDAECNYMFEIRKGRLADYRTALGGLPQGRIELRMGVRNSWSLQLSAGTVPLPARYPLHGYNGNKAGSAIGGPSYFTYRPFRTTTRSRLGTT